MDNLKVRVRYLLIDLIKREFPKLKAEFNKKLRGLKDNLDKMGPSRSNEHTQRAYLNKMSEAFQTLSRDALNAYYNGDKIFTRRHDLRLITRVVEINEKFNRSIEKNGHMWPFAADPVSLKLQALIRKSGKSGLHDFLDLGTTKELLGRQKSPGVECADISVEYPELEDLLDFDTDVVDLDGDAENIMDYIEGVYKSSRGQDLGTVSCTKRLL